MAGSGLLSGGIVFAIAAALWIVYLMPTWLRRNEFLATERNAVRLQQTLRILAETSEVPREVQVETTARGVAEQQKILKKYEAEALLKARLEALALVEAQREAEKARQAALTEQVRQARRAAAARLKLKRARRRARLATTLVLFLSLGAVGAGGWMFATGGSVLLLAGGALAATTSIAMLARMARVSRRTGVSVAVPEVARVSQAFEPVSFDETVAVQATWTPTPLPRPLHLSQGSAAAETIAQADAHAALRRAALAQVLAERAAEMAPKVASIAPAARATPAAAVPEESELRPQEQPSRFAGMGVVNDAEIAPTDLTALLQRRRAAS